MAAIFTERNYTQKIIYQEPADAEEFAATVGRRSLLPSVSFDKEKINEKIRTKIMEKRGMKNIKVRFFD